MNPHTLAAIPWADVLTYAQFAGYAITAVVGFVAGHRKQIADLTAAARSLGEEAALTLADIRAHAKSLPRSK